MQNGAKKRTMPLARGVTAKLDGTKSTKAQKPAVAAQMGAGVAGSASSADEERLKIMMAMTLLILKNI